MKFPAILLALTAFLGLRVEATSFEEFGKLNDDDEAGLIAYLVDASAHYLKAGSKPDQAAKAIAFFHDSSPSGGVHQLALNLRMLYETNKRNETRASNSVPLYQVEDAMTLTLREEGLVVPSSYLIKASDGFVPVGLPRKHIYGDQ